MKNTFDFAWRQWLRRQRQKARQELEAEESRGRVATTAGRPGRKAHLRRLQERQLLRRQHHPQRAGPHHSNGSGGGRPAAAQRGPEGQGAQRRQGLRDG